MMESAMTDEKKTLEQSAADQSPVRKPPVKQPPGEIGGPTGPEPTRFGDWEFKGRCSDF
ncbi:MAG: succinate dehydrogenase assembly factor 4 [Niveispirillum sp.]|uniref:succinate dehydrogenase assembly factor 4 n=1 Tax=Niveispirillum sp. TaxID=1917217 RepID=UPI004036CE4D